MAQELDTIDQIVHKTRCPGSSHFYWPWKVRGNGDVVTAIIDHILPAGPCLRHLIFFLDGIFFFFFSLSLLLFTTIDLEAGKLVVHFLQLNRPLAASR